MIQGHGASLPEGFFIGDSPTGEDIRTGRALSGYQENQLAGFCREVNLDIRQFYQTCLIKETDVTLPTQGLKKKSKKELEEIQKYTNDLIKVGLPLLVEEINELKPKLLIPLGELSFHALTGLRGIRKFRGSVILADGALGLKVPIKVLPILGPYPYLNQEYKLRFITRVDFTKIPGNLHYNTSLPGQNVWIARSSTALRAFLDRSYNESGTLVFDIETFMGMPTCISFCFNGEESVCVPFMDQSIDIDHRVLMLDLVARILVSPIRKVNQNVKYDWKRLEAWGFRVNNVVGDTMLAASTLYCEFPKNLGFLTSLYTNLPYFKDEGREYDPNIHKKEQFYLYNAKDSLATHQIYHKQMAEVDEQGVRFVYDRLIQLIPIYRRMEDRGILVNRDIRSDLQAKYWGLYEIEKMKLESLSEIKDANPLSSVQMNRLVFEELGFTKIRGVKGTDEESLELLITFGEAKRSPIFGKDILQIILNCRKIHKVLEILELTLYPDDRFRCEFNLAGTQTGRSGAGKSTDKIIVIEKGKIKLVELGHSLQTIGKHGFMIDGVTYGRDIRDMFIASPGYTLVECDLSGAEARVDTVLAGNFNLLNIFDGPIGIHRLTGSWVYQCDPSEIVKNRLVDGIDRYHMAKTVRHAAERNMMEDRLVAMTACTRQEATRVLKEIHGKQPEIRDVFHHDVRQVINKTHCLIAPNGRRHDFFDRLDNHTYNKGISQLPQAIVSDQTKFSLIPTAAEAPWSHFLTEQHDGVLSEVPEGREMEYSEIYKRNIEIPINFRSCSLPREYDLTIPCEVSIGKSWYHLEEIR